MFNIQAIDERAGAAIVLFIAIALLALTLANPTFAALASGLFR